MNQKRISYSVTGCESRGVIVAFHGVTDNAASLSDLAREWKKDWKIYLVDTLGHGLSESFTAEELKDPFAAMVTQMRSVVVEAARTSLSRKVVLIGHSLGGAIAATIAQQLPDIVQALVLEDPALLTQEQKELYRSSATDLVKRQEMVTEHVGDAISELMKVYTAWPPSEYGAWAQGKTQVDRKFVATGVVGTLGREVFEKLKMPTLLVTGDQDDVLFGKSGQAELEKLGKPFISSVLISDASHTVRRDQPEEFYRVVGAFINRYGTRQELPEPFIAEELRDVIAATPKQDTENVAAMREEGEKLLADVRPKDGIVATDVQVGEKFNLRFLRAEGAESKVAVLAIHGGGFVAGAARYDDERNSELVELFRGAVIASPDYRLAPEHPWPAGAQDCADSLRYLANKYPDLPLIVFGDSAGAGLAQQAIQIVQNSDAPINIERAILFEPCLEPGMATRSFETYKDGPIWTKEASEGAWRQYLGDVTKASPYIPSRAVAELMPPTFVIVNPADPLRDEGIHFAVDLADAGVPTELHMYAGTFHGALSVPGTNTWERVKEDVRSFMSTPII